MSNPTRRAGRPRGPRHLRLTVEFLDSGELRISTPEARGAARTARGPDQLWHRLEYLRNEAAIAGYAMSRGVRYDLDELTDPSDPTEPARQRRPATPRELAGDRSEVSYSNNRVVRPDQVHPSEYSPNPDGSWTGRAGRRLRDPKKINTLLINRGRLGLATTYQEWLDQTAGEGEAS